MLLPALLHVTRKGDGAVLPDRTGARVGAAELLETLQKSFTGKPFDYRGRTVQVTPAPSTPGGPQLQLGGSSEPAARRAARLGVGFMPSSEEIWEHYRGASIEYGRPDPGPYLGGDTSFFHVTEDVERGWEQHGPFFLHESNAYGAWAAVNDGASPYKVAGSIDELRATGAYAVLTPEQYVEELRAAPFPFAMLHPMCGGTPPELAWSSLRLLEQEVLPGFA